LRLIRGDHEGGSYSLSCHLGRTDFRGSSPSGKCRCMNAAKWGTVKSTRPYSGLKTRPLSIRLPRTTAALPPTAVGR
jgi:hypothetical protein